MGWRKWIAITIAVTITASGSVLLGFQFYREHVSFTGLAITNRSDRAIDFLVSTDVSGGVLHVEQGSADSFTVARG